MTAHVLLVGSEVFSFHKSPLRKIRNHITQAYNFHQSSRYLHNSKPHFKAKEDEMACSEQKLAKKSFLVMPLLVSKPGRNTTLHITMKLSSMSRNITQKRKKLIMANMGVMSRGSAVLSKKTSFDLLLYYFLKNDFYL